MSAHVSIYHLNLNNQFLLITKSVGDDGSELPYQVDIANCTVQPCPLLRGSDAVVNIDFFARKHKFSF